MPNLFRYRSCGAIKTRENNNETKKVIKVHKGPICGKLTDRLEYRPFCSKRCADVDLGNWFNQSYVIEGSSSSSENNEDEE